MSDFEISLIISAYNEEASIGQCLNSAISQDFDSYEIIIVDDGSSDNTGEICREYEKLCDKIRYFCIENSGISFARNYAISKSKGKYIAFSDADDVFARQYLSFMYELIKQYDADMVINDTFRGFRGDEFKPYITQDSGLYDWRSLMYVKLHTYYPQHQVFGKLFKRNIVEKAKFPEGHVIEDFFIFPEYCYLSSRIIYNRSKLYMYCLDKAGSIMRSKKTDSLVSDQLLAAKRWVTFFEDKDVGIRNLSAQNYLEKLFVAYASLDSGMVTGDIKGLRVYVKSELNDAYRLFFEEINTLEGISNNRLRFLIKPKYYLMKHFMPMVKYWYKLYWKISKKAHFGDHI